jgi:CheY-like chemotaxis protein
MNGIGRGRPLTILLVDDEDIVRIGTAEMIRDLSHTVVEAGGGAEALDLLAGGLAPDVVVTDYKMPRMDGAELSRRLEADHPSLPVLIITGHTGTTDDVLHLPLSPSRSAGWRSAPRSTRWSRPTTRSFACRAARRRRFSA